jgi:starch synthase (maltosyl-transferring)
MGLFHPRKESMISEGRKRVVIENVRPEVDGGKFPIKRVEGEKVAVEADIFSDGHDLVRAVILYRGDGDKKWREAPLRHVANDRWEGWFRVGEPGYYRYTIQGWVDHPGTWLADFEKKYRAGQDVAVDLLVGADFLDGISERASGKDANKLREIARTMREEKDAKSASSLVLGDEVREMSLKYPDRKFATTYEKELPVVVDRRKALVSAWYEMFPRSCDSAGHGTFANCEKMLPYVSRMGFDVLYLPPIHPIGRTKRKGKNNLPAAQTGDPGSPWAIGAEEGGHKAVNPDLGTLEDFERFVGKAREHGVEVALDLAFQCSPDHPYVREHPEWFRWRPDGSVAFAENPPKKYEDIIPLNFETEAWKELWEELRSVILFWMERGVRIFRVDNPHTKSFLFWEWLIDDVKRRYPDAIFLSEAFTRPKVMYRLARLGFTQSYTYFTWRNTKWEIMEYVNELTRTEVREFFRPNFWTNTPDILPEHLQYGGRPAFVMRLILAATLCSNYGIYGPAYELCVSDAMEGKEEYLASEKYEVKRWDLDRAESLRDLIGKINRIRSENPALQSTWNVNFHESENEKLLLYTKTTEDLENILLIVVNLDPYNKQSGRIRVPLEELDMAPTRPYLVHDLISEDKYVWFGEWNHVELDPHVMPAHIFRVHRRMSREQDFDYFM